MLKQAIVVVASSYLLYNIYQAAVTTLFVSHLPYAITQLTRYIESSQPTLQLGLFLFQEVSASIGVYLRLAAGILAVYSAILLIKNDKKLVNVARKMLLLESLYFALLIPAGINQIVGFFISYSQFLNVYAGVSSLLQALLIFPPLFILSRRLKEPLYSLYNMKLAGFAASMYLFGLWAKHGLLWGIALKPLEKPPTVIETVGSVNSLVTLLVAAVIMTIFWFTLKKTPRRHLFGTVLILVGCYFLVYAIVSVWVPLYLSFLPLTEFWMISLLILGATMLND